MTTPQPKVPRLLRFTVWFVALIQLAEVVHQGKLAAAKGYLFNGVVAVICAVGVVGLLRRLRWGRRIAVVFLWSRIFVSQGALSPPFDLTVEEMEKISLLFLSLRFAGICVVAVACLHVLGRFKEYFRATWL